MPDAPPPPTRTWRVARTAFRIVRPFLIAYLLILAAMMIFEESLIFFPSKYPDGDWRLPSGVRDAEFAADDGVKLHGWYAPHDSPRAVVLFLHGNAGNITHRADILDVLHRELGASVLMFDYRGYGRSEGSPSGEGILRDARAARAWLAKAAGVPERDIVLVAESLGTGVAVDLAAKDGARAVVLHSAYPSLPDVAAFHYPWLPVRQVMRTRLDSRALIGDYRGPLLMSHGDADDIIPLELGRQLYEAAPAGNKEFLTLSRHGHNDRWPPQLYGAIDRLWDRLATAQRAATE